MSKKICNQKDHKWEVIQQFPYRCKCTICGVVGKIYHTNHKAGILPLKGNDTISSSKNYKPQI
jgi:hypothetical protein